ncbi:dTDP-4-dehydrorhamnose 3,5-epimerase [Polaribacter glomeratus]|uniref:dTDP-4-dehydrorhamnose 3,5-epimerase n=1 Tax=Polaribacter glomeratus TaxID=102 RepID=A0A2S7WHU6_9FLAO|nr:dTDP-4-dehydrorhamnose 3,5-epimerase [Polaribacter glomeratus]PQJ77187.1 dTDP-4-dehydrorhamnose 3,5-epimerase [Polaribacter glomeratus]TXD65163.1 dTDP-4-dehydrorhamnose 3,5-epimerase [Polaribacter glomeratus]
MIVKETPFIDCFIIEPKLINDNRGSFLLNYNKNEFNKAVSKDIDFVLENESISKYGAIRGLHLQTGKNSQAKLVRVISGKILDVIVDVRPNSNTFGKSFSLELSSKNNIQLFIPRGFLHGFSVLEENTIVNYKCDNYYNKDSEDGVLYNDLELNIDWKLKKDEIILSEKDKKLKTFKEFIN